MREAYLEIMEEAYFEVTEAFRGLADRNVWKRPAEGLLAIGEIAGHMAYWEAVKFAGDGAHESDLAKCPVSSLLIDHRFRYYQTTIATQPSPEHLSMSAEEVCSELLRVHRESFAHFNARDINLNDHPPGWWPNLTYKAFLSYAPIHVAYHTGQIYSVRHLLGEETPDN